MGILATILLVCAAGALAFFYLGVWSTVRHTSLPIPTLADEAAYPPISLLKPIKGTDCLLYTSPSPRDRTRSRMPSSA